MARLEPIRKTPCEPDNPEITDEEGRAGARAVVNLFARWKLTDAQAVVLLGGLSPRTWARWKTGAIGRLSRDLKRRLAHLLGVHFALRTIFNEPERGYGWIKRSNTVFDGASALDVMLGGEMEDIIRVRRYLYSVMYG